MLPEPFHRYRHLIDAELSNLLDGFDLPLYDMLRYHLGWSDRYGNPTQHSNGKAIRSTLCLLSCESICGDYERALPAAAALELIHNFSLIHDDIQDNDLERRHRPTVWAVYGKAQAINAGMAMRVLADVSMMRLAELGIPPLTQLQALELLDESSLRLIEGQYLDLSFENQQNIATDDYLRMVKLKTVSLLACSTKLGAMLANEDQELIQPLMDFGSNLGYAFQLRDDMLGIWGSEINTGKPVGSDIVRKKKSYPIVFAWENCKRKEKDALNVLYQKEQIDDEGKAVVLDILEKTQARNQTQNLIEAYCRDARSEIEQAPVSTQSRASFSAIIDFLSNREF